MEIFAYNANVIKVIKCQKLISLDEFEKANSFSGNT